MYGLFSDEDLVEGDFQTPEEAKAALLDRYNLEDGLEIEEICPDHPQHARFGCEECDSEESAEDFYEDLED